MVKEIKKEGKKYYVCEDCKFLYLDGEWAEKCEKFCSENKMCNREITKHSVGVE